MNIPIKTGEEIEKMRTGGKILGRILTELQKKVAPGITKEELNIFAEKLFREFEVQPSFKGYLGYPAAICVAVNEEVVHAIPTNRKLKEGDIVSLDLGVCYQDLHTDAAITVPVGKIKDEIASFLKTVKLALEKAISSVKPGNRIGNLSEIIQKTVEGKGYSIIRDLTGHGIGKSVHEPPTILNFGHKHSGPSLKPGMTLAIEPIAAQGQRFIETLTDHWTVVTKDRSLAAQFEHTVLVTKTGYEILTLPPKY